MNSVLFAVLVAAEKPLDPNDVKPGWVALGIVALLIIAMVFLSLSFLKHSRKANQPWRSDEHRDQRP